MKGIAPRLLYVSFDEVPSAKGASTHIEAFARALAAHFGALTLVTPGPRDLEPSLLAPGLRHIVIGCAADNPIGRCRLFRERLMPLLEDTPDLIHFRSIFEGFPIARSRQGIEGRAMLGSNDSPALQERNFCESKGVPSLRSRLLYEVNGFPSIEMKYLYPHLWEDEILLRKLAAQEQVCLDAANRIITVSEVSRSNICNGYNVLKDKVKVIPNGYSPEKIAFSPARVYDGGPLELLYVGTLTVWQGLEVLLDALHLLRQRIEARLTILGPTPGSRLRQLEPLIERYGLQDCVCLAGKKSTLEVVELLHRSHASVVPLLAIDRNTVQGCCPLKMIESMGAGCPVVASDLPVTRALGAPGKHFLAAPPGNARALADTLFEVHDQPDRMREMSRAAHAHVLEHFTWEQATAQLIQVYEELLAQ